MVEDKAPDALTYRSLREYQAVFRERALPGQRRLCPSGLAGSGSLVIQRIVGPALVYRPQRA